MGKLSDSLRDAVETLAYKTSIDQLKKVAVREGETVLFSTPLEKILTP